RVTDRRLEPIGLFHSHEQWYLMAFCHLRNDYRTFRLDRFSKIHLTDLHYSTSNHPSLQSYLDKVSQERELHQIVLEVPNGFVKYLVNSKYNNGFVSERKLGDKMEMTFMNSSVEAFVRWVISLGDVAVIKQPVVVRDRLLQLVEDIKQMQG